MFTAHGNFGSRVFDPISSSPSLLILICDNCLLANKEQVMTARLKQETRHEYGPWDPQAAYN